MAEVAKLLTDYLDYLEIEKNRSPKTRENYERYLKEFLRFTNIKTSQQITEDVVRKFRLDLAHRPATPKQTHVGGSTGAHGQPIKKITQNKKYKFNAKFWSN